MKRRKALIQALTFKPATGYQKFRTSLFPPCICLLPPGFFAQLQRVSASSLRPFLPSRMGEGWRRRRGVPPSCPFISQELLKVSPPAVTRSKHLQTWPVTSFPKFHSIPINLYCLEAYEQNSICLHKYQVKKKLIPT